METEAAVGTRRRTDVVCAVFGVWGLVGLSLDGWAHTHHRPESVFTPWHAVLYSGIALGVVSHIALSARHGRATADRLQRIGLGLFLAGAAGDLIWHSVFGIEVSLGSLTSPTHLVLMVAVILMVSGPARATVPTRSVIPALVTLVVATMVVSFFTRYMSAFRYAGLNNDEIGHAFAIGSILATNTILLVPMMFAADRWELPVGSYAFFVGAFAIGIQTQFDIPSPLLIVAAAGAGFIVDLLVHFRRDDRARTIAIGAPIAIWTLWLLAVHLTHGVHAPAEVMLGMLVLPALEGWALHALLQRRASV